MNVGKFRDRLRQSALEVRDRGRRLAELNLQLAKKELQRALALYGAAVGMLVAALLLVLYGLGFLFATICIALDIVLPLWASALIVTVLLFLIAATLVAIARNRINAARTPAPQKAIAEAQTTATAVQSAARTAAQRARDAARGRGSAVGTPPARQTDSGTLAAEAAPSAAGATAGSAPSVTATEPGPKVPPAQTGQDKISNSGGE